MDDDEKALLADVVVKAASKVMIQDKMIDQIKRLGLEVGLFKASANVTDEAIILLGLQTLIERLENYKLSANFGEPTYAPKAKAKARIFYKMS